MQQSRAGQITKVSFIVPPSVRGRKQEEGMEQEGVDELTDAQVAREFSRMFQIMTGWKDLEKIKSYEFQHKDDIYANLSRFQRLLRAEESHLKNKHAGSELHDAWRTSNIHFLQTVLEIANVHWGRGLQLVLGTDIEESLQANSPKESLLQGKLSTTTTNDVMIVDWGRTLIKVSSKSTHSLNQLLIAELGDTEESEQEDDLNGLGIVKHAYKLMATGKEVIFFFKNTPPIQLANALEAIGIRVINGINSIPEPRFPEGVPIGSVINLDVSTLIALVSEFTWASGAHRTALLHVKCLESEYSFREQQRKELEYPLFSHFKSIFAGRPVVMCKAAFDRFNDEIIPFFGGKSEKQRWNDFIQSRTGDLANIFHSFSIINASRQQLQECAADVVDFSAFPSLLQTVLATGIYVSQQQKDQNSIVFEENSVHSPLTVTTLTSNWSAMKSAKGKILLNRSDCNVVVHQERSLCEKKLVCRIEKEDVTDTSNG